VSPWQVRVERKAAVHQDSLSVQQQCCRPAGAAAGSKLAGVAAVCIAIPRMQQLAGLPGALQQLIQGCAGTQQWCFKAPVRAHQSASRTEAVVPPSAVAWHLPNELLAQWHPAALAAGVPFWQQRGCAT
jgi:hypothetical protein